MGCASLSLHLQLTAPCSVTQVRRAQRGQRSTGEVGGTQAALPDPHLASPGIPNPQECFAKAPPGPCRRGKHAMPPQKHAASSSSSQSLPSPVTWCLECSVGLSSPLALAVAQFQPSYGCQRQQSVYISGQQPCPTCSSCQQLGSPALGTAGPRGGASGNLLLAKSRQCPGMTAKTSVTASSRARTLRLAACLPAQQCPRSAVTLSPHASPASPPLPCPGTEKTVLKQRKRESLGMFDLFFLGTCQAGRAEHVAGRSFSFGSGLGLSSVPQPPSAKLQRVCGKDEALGKYCPGLLARAVVLPRSGRLCS